LVNRRGEIEYVTIGDRKSIQLPDFKRTRTGFRRFRGLRCLHTHLDSTGLTRDDLTDLSLLRLDAMCAIEVASDGGPGFFHAAHLVPDFKKGHAADVSAVWKKMSPKHVHEVDLNFQLFIKSLESEFARKTPKEWLQSRGERAICIGITTGSIEEEAEKLEELKELARSTDVVILDEFLQKRPKLDPRYLMGRGKLKDLIIRSMQLGASLLIFNRNLTPTQIRSICKETDLKVIDRTQLILDIFARHAHAREGKIQVELAQLKYMMPRLVEYDDALSRLTGGIGGRGPGETTLEINRRRIKDRIAFLEQKLIQIRKARSQRRKERTRNRAKVVSIVGYTNAGKSTLLNALTNSDVLVENKLFATLDPVSRRTYLEGFDNIIISDTVGFIHDLPEELITTFKATLEEIESSSLIIHLVDASTHNPGKHIVAVHEILCQLGLDTISQILVFNKIDLISKEKCFYLGKIYDALFISAQEGLALDKLKRLLHLKFRRIKKCYFKHRPKNYQKTGKDK